MFDNSDNDTSRTGELTPHGTLEKQNGKTYSGPGQSTAKSYPDRHADAVAACAWMQEQYEKKLVDGAWIIFAHIERDGAWNPATGGGYNVEHFRDFNNAAPDICFGFEGAPGHQVNSGRGGFNPATAFDGTYGGVGYYTATVGGLWDALLGEGRRWFNFASSDYHRHYTNGGDDFYPGEYQRTWTYVIDRNRDGDYSTKEIAQALRSGNSFHVMGDLINHLQFSAWQMDEAVAMGGTLQVHRARKAPLKIKIRFKSPMVNSNGDTPVVDHIDLIAGEITGKIAPTDPNYTKATNETVRVIARFTVKDWKVDKDGYNVIVHTLQNVQKDMYLRLRGTNVPVNTPFETDENGNPLADRLVSENLGVDGAEEAWRDLWFYSNPIFVAVK
jgi:hypothetical protein